VCRAPGAQPAHAPGAERVVTTPLELLIDKLAADLDSFGMRPGCVWTFQRSAGAREWVEQLAVAHCVPVVWPETSARESAQTRLSTGPRVETAAPRASGAGA
jgi:hypothetical protein